MVIVLVATVAATIAVVAIQLGMFRISSEVRLTAVETATNTLHATRDKVRATMEQDPLGMYSYVLNEELPRVCVPTDTVVNPGSAWPGSCGTFWEYAPAPAEATSGVMVTPPSPDDPSTVVQTFARVGNITVGAVDTYRVGTKMRPRIYSGGTLNLAGLGVTEVNGPVYAFDDVTTTGVTTSPGALVATEEDLVGALTGTGAFYAARESDVGPPAVYTIRRVYTQPMPPSLLRSSFAVLSGAGCPGIAPFAVGTTSSALCLEPGGQLRSAAGGLVSLPAGAQSFLILPGTTADVRIYASTASLDAMPGAACSASCDLSALASGATNPGNIAYWGTSLGEFNLPSSGVIGTRADVFVGLCGAAFATGGPCASNEAPSSSAFDRSFTVAAGTLSEPADVYLSGPISATTGHVGVVASGDVVIPYFAAPAGQVLDLDVDIAALGEGSSSEIVRSWPNTTTTGGSARGRVTLDGLLLLPEQSVSTPAFTARRVLVPADASDAPAWFPGPAMVLERISSSPMRPADALNGFNGTS